MTKSTQTELCLAELWSLEGTQWQTTSERRQRIANLRRFTIVTDQIINRSTGTTNWLHVFLVQIALVPPMSSFHFLLTPVFPNSQYGGSLVSHLPYISFISSLKCSSILSTRVFINMYPRHQQWVPPRVALLQFRPAFSTPTDPG